MKKTYFLFGEKACSVYAESGIDRLLSHIRMGRVEATVFEFIHGTTSPVDLLYAFLGHGDYAVINDREYRRLKKLV